MAKKMNLGPMAFLGIVVVSILSGLGILAGMETLGTLLLVIMGVIVGLKNISGSETTKFIVVMLALIGGVGAVALASLGPLSATMTAIFDSLLIGFGTAAFVVGLKVGYSLVNR